MLRNFASAIKVALLASTCFVAPTAWADGAMTVGMPIEPTGLDPTIAAPVAIREVVWGNVFEGLTGLDQTGAVVPLLATSWNVSDDGKDYLFNLRSGVTFHNGVPFDANVVKYTLDRARAEESTNAQKAFFEPIENVEVVDDLTIKVSLSEPKGLFLYWLAWGDAVMVEPSTVETNNISPNGTGPFKFVSWQPGANVKLEKNTSYWDPALPHLDQVTFRFISDARAQVAAIESGEVDAFPNFQAPELFTQFVGDDRFETVVGVTPRKVVAGLNNAKKPFSDIRVRQALMSAIDRNVVVEGAYFGFGAPIGSHFAQSDAGYKDLTGHFPYDPEKARALLTEAGYPDGFTFTMKTPQMSYTTRSAEVVQAFLADVGVTMNIVPSEFPAKWIEEVFLAKDYDATIVDHAEPMDIDIYTRPGYYFQYENADLSDVVSKGMSAAEAADRAKYLGQAQDILADEVPSLFLFTLPRLNVWKTGVTGLWANEPISNLYMKEADWADGSQ